MLPAPVPGINNIMEVEEIEDGVFARPGGQLDIRRLHLLRRELLRSPKPDASLAAVDTDLRSLLAYWFNRGFLRLRRIDWSTPANILEKIIQYEAVHEIRNWDDLKRRLAPQDRRCFAFFHPRMPDEPLIFVEVALVEGMADNVQNLLDPTAPVQDAKNHGGSRLGHFLAA